MATREEVEALKANWLADAIYDLYDTEGFEEYREELMAFQQEHEAIWEANWVEEERQLKEKAEKLGLVGLYKLLLRQEEELEKLRRKVDNDY